MISKEYKIIFSKTGLNNLWSIRIASNNLGSYRDRGSDRYIGTNWKVRNARVVSVRDVSPLNRWTRFSYIFFSSLTSSETKQSLIKTTVFTNFKIFISTIENSILFPMNRTFKIMNEQLLKWRENLLWLRNSFENTLQLHRYETMIKRKRFPMQKHRNRVTKA